jgi:ABC-type transporter Mla subunit MlaD
MDTDTELDGASGPAPRAEGASAWTTALGVLAVLGVVGGLWSTGDVDAATWASVAVVSAVWVGFVAAASRWQARARAPALAPPAHALLQVDGQDRLPVGEAEALVDAASPRPPSWLGAGTTTLISLGLAGTFLGLTLGLFNALPLLLAKQTDAAIQALLAGAQLAFVKSLLGILLGTVWSFRMIGLHAVEAGLRADALARLQARFPPISPEQLLARESAAAAARAAALDQRLTADAKAAADRHAALMAGLAQLPQGEAVLERLGEVADAVEAAGGLTVEAIGQANADIAAVLEAPLAEHLRKIDTAARSMESILKDMSEADSTRSLVGQLTKALGPVITEGLQVPLAGIQHTLQGFGDKGGQAVGEVVKEGTKASVNELVTELGNLKKTIRSISENLTSAVSAAHSASDTISKIPGPMTTAANAWTTAARQADAVKSALQAAAASSGEIKSSLSDSSAGLRTVTQDLNGVSAGLREAAKALGKPVDGETESADGLVKALTELSGLLSSLGKTIEQSSTKGVGETVNTLNSAARGLVGAVNGMNALLEPVTKLSQLNVANAKEMATKSEEIRTNLREAVEPLNTLVNDAKTAAGEVRGAAAEVANAGQKAAGLVQAEGEVLKGAASEFTTASATASDQVKALELQLRALRELHTLLKGAWVADYGRLEDSYKKVAEAWKAAAAAADKDRKATTDAIADTARVVADAVGVQEPLGALLKALTDLTTALKAHPSAGPSAPPGP